MKSRITSRILACPTWQTQRQVFETLGTPSNERVVTARHRGDFTDQYAENTLEAFHASYLACRPAIETDVRYTSDDQLVIFHDTHIGKMLEPGYDPRTGVGPNALLESLTLAQLQEKKVLNVFTRQPAPRENPQWPGVHTVEEMLRDYISFSPQANALVHLEIKTVLTGGQFDVVKSRKAITDTAKLLQVLHNQFPQAELFKRVILKFQMALFSTPFTFRAAMLSESVEEMVMAEPVISPAGQQQIDSSADNIPNPDGETYASKTARAVAWWSQAPALEVPCVEVVIKDSTDFINKRIVPPYLGKQRGYAEPYAFSGCGALERCNGTVGTMAEMVTIVKTKQKALGVFVPIPDYLMWREDRYVNFGVPNIAAGKNPSIAAEKAYYNNNSQCCYDLDDRLAPGVENFDDRMLIGWQRSIGCNVITADDTDSIDYAYFESGQLEQNARPDPVLPPDKMNSVLAWELDYRARPDPLITLQSDGGASVDGYVRCLWFNNTENNLSFTYNCDSDYALYQQHKVRQLRTRVSKTDGTMQIVNENGSHCLHSTLLGGEDTTGAYWGACDHPGAHWTWNKDYQLINEYLGQASNALIRSTTRTEAWGDSGPRAWGLISKPTFEPGNTGGRKWKITLRSVPAPKPPDPPDPTPEELGFFRRWFVNPFISLNRAIFGPEGGGRNGL